jgi:hypothetical protein
MVGDEALARRGRPCDPSRRAAQAVALDFAPRTIVMNRGRVVFDGESARLAADNALLESLIGVAGTEDNG